MSSLGASLLAAWCTPVCPPWCSSTRSWSFFMPGELPRYAKACGVPVDELLWEHTVFPYVTAYMPRAKVAQLRAKVVGDYERSGSLSSLVQSGTGGTKALRYCPACSASEVEELGESYWHRSHNLPAVKVCHRHGCALHDVPIPSVDRAHLVPLPMHQEVREPTLPTSHGALFELAVRSAKLLDSRPEEDISNLSAYRARALEVGYELPSGDTAGWQVARDLQKHFSNELLAGASCPYSDRSKHHWPARMLRPGANVTFSPAKHVLLQSFLAAAKPGRKTMEYAEPVRRKRDFSVADKELAAGMRRRTAEALRANVRLSVQAVMGNTRYWHAFKAYRDRFPATAAALEEYRTSDAAWRQKGGRSERSVVG
jgi:hypothetical protein